jgi:tetratricopeptide (TPR) repeat protein
MGQSRQDAREIFEDGLFFFNRGDYKEAAFNFRRLADQFPDQSNYQFKLGECYMNIPGSECLAVPCFESAVRNTVPKQKYDRKAFEETDAPLHAWFYLGNVYRICNRLSDALRAYSTFVNSPYYEGNYNLAIVENEIKSCERAKIIEDNPIDMTEQVLDTMVNTEAAELHPVLSADGNTLVFVRRLKFYDAILQTERKNGKWGTPVNLNPQVGSDGEFYPACLSPDGKDLYLIKTGVSSDIWVSHKNGNDWSRAVKLNDNVNSAMDETSAWVSGSGVLYFASTRKGGHGGSDLYFSRRGSNGDWGKPKNMGKVINTPFDEDSPCLIPGDSVLFFSSKGHFSMGGYDVFTARRTEKSWRDPDNLGFPINNTSDNTGYVALNGGFTGYYARINARDPSREEDIFEALLQVKP